MIKKFSAAVAAFTMIGVGAAHAEGGDWYVAGQAGIRAVEKEQVTATGLDMDVELHNGLYLSTAVGKAFETSGVGYRLEGEFAWRKGKLNAVDINGTAVPATGDGFSALSFMTNGYVDFNNSSRFTPYIGAGIGVVQLDGDINGGANVLDDKAISFAFQGIGGLDVAVTERASLFADLRYMRAVGSKMTLTGTAGSGSVDVAYDAYTVGLGVRLRF